MCRKLFQVSWIARVASSRTSTARALFDTGKSIRRKRGNRHVGAILQ